MSQQLGDYVLEGQVGAGAHAVVYRGHHVARPRQAVAIKHVRSRPASQVVEQVRAEADALARLAHPSIVGVLDLVSDGLGVALVMPLLTGGSLAGRLADGRPLPPVAVADLGARIGSALAAAHGAGIIHRDVKPANILYDREGQPLLSDFGVATLRGEAAARQGGEPVPGTAGYLDPAVLAGDEPSPRADIYALGAVCYEALAGQPPYAASTPQATLQAAERGRHMPLEQLVDHAPPGLLAAIERALDRDPERRFGAAHELASRLEEVRLNIEDRLEDRGSDPLPPPAGATADDGPAPQPPPGEDDARSETRLFGPGPPEPDAAPPLRRETRPWLLGAAAAVLAVPVLVVWLLGGWGQPAAAPTPTVPTPSLSATTPAASPTPCPDASPPDPASGTAVLGDLEGRGCDRYAAWDGSVLTVPGDDAPIRYQLGEPGDQLVLGDWDCDGRDTPALYRPATGELFYFDRFAGDGELESRPAVDSGVEDGEPQVGVGADGCDEVLVRPGP